ncbi:hypothetical protein FALBO_13186 [Fusarium albosuccineum]|uniref:Calcineurin-like phosphoesterase domain-containing protein n=1 Tax=Fusarium albosuccineum TaxID=1237068 RepID=A0A8H4L129_9HYPO|nr:hypothetical protein FALBO_13186 [Fusarium albosuccineum]
MALPRVPSEANELSISDKNSSSDSCMSWNQLTTIIEDLDPSLVPSPSSPEAKRLVIVGDVHGHLAELKKLLQDIQFDRDHGDHLIFVGDLIVKGPDSSGVVQLAMDLGASAVRGNNEDRVLAAYAAMKRDPDLKKIADQESAPFIKDGDKAAEPQKAENGVESRDPASLKRYSADRDFSTAASLTEAQVSWLASRPLILRIPPLKGAVAPPWNAGSILVAHAGLVPSLPLEEQDQWAVMNMRTLAYLDPDAKDEAIQADLAKGVRSRVRRFIAFGDASEDEIKAKWAQWADLVDEGRGYSAIYRDGCVPQPVEGRDGDAWVDAWNRAQNAMELSEQRTVVIYGHDARAGVQINPEVEYPGETAGAPAVKGTRYAFGLDSGCVYGNQLSALVIARSSDGQGISHSIVQVNSTEVKEDNAEGKAS